MGREKLIFPPFSFDFFNQGLDRFSQMIAYIFLKH